VLLLWLKVRCGGPGPIFCRPQARKSKGVPSTAWDTHQKVSCDALTALVRELLADSGMLDVGKVATHSGKRTGVQLYEALGMSDSWVMDKGGWDSASAFVNYKSLSNRLEMRSSFFLRAGILKQVMCNLLQFWLLVLIFRIFTKYVVFFICAFVLYAIANGAQGARRRDERWARGGATLSGRRAAQSALDAARRKAHWASGTAGCTGAGRGTVGRGGARAAREGWRAKGTCWGRARWAPVTVWRGRKRSCRGALGVARLWGSGRWARWGAHGGRPCGTGGAHGGARGVAACPGC